MTNQQPPGDGNGSNSEDRRSKLKQILAGGGVIAGGTAIPKQWSRAVVESVVLPAHAQTTGISEGNFSGQGNTP
ncbi:MAG: hypothetical protein ACI8P9_001991 [Parasphingorhabdus sp.]|jgi:hypothetical protein